MLRYRLDGQKGIIIMIKFSNKDNDRQLIEITIKGNTPTGTIIENIKNTYSALQQANTIFDDSEILIEIDNVDYGFSLNELREYIKTFAAAAVTHFSVDTDEPNQRYYG